MSTLDITAIRPRIGISRRGHCFAYSEPIMARRRGHRGEDGDAGRVIIGDDARAFEVAKRNRSARRKCISANRNLTAAPNRISRLMAGRVADSTRMQALPVTLVNGVSTDGGEYQYRHLLDVALMQHDATA